MQNFENWRHQVATAGQSKAGKSTPNYGQSFTIKAITIGLKIIFIVEKGQVMI